jgi:uncharacterized iron-regulated membrane protein
LRAAIWADRGKLRSDPPPCGNRLSVSELLRAVQRQRAELPANATLTLRSDPREPAEIRMGRESVVYVNLYSGHVLAGGSPGTRAFFQKMIAWHRWLGVEGPGRAAAKAITGACNLAFLVLIASGSYLWIPRWWSWQAVRQVAWFRMNLSGKARDFNWHNVFGIWTFVPLFFIVLCAAPMSYSLANDLIYRMTDSEPPRAPGGRNGGGARRGPAAMTANLDRLWVRAAAHSPGVAEHHRRRGAGPMIFAIDHGNGGQPQKRSTLTLHSSTGAVVRLENFADLSPARRLRMWSRFVHTGEYYAAAGQAVAGIASAAGQCWSGPESRSPCAGSPHGMGGGAKGPCRKRKRLRWSRKNPLEDITLRVPRLRRP